MPKVNTETKFDIGDKVCRDVKNIIWETCDCCGTRMAVDTEYQPEKGRVCGWRISEYGTMGVSVMYTVRFPSTEIVVHEEDLFVDEG